MSLSRDTSGDLLADRRYDYAEALAREGDHVAAADLFAQVADLVPGWAPAWLALGLAREKAGDADAALDALRRAAALDAADMLGAALHVARLSGNSPARLGPSFVATLFDQYADRFDSHLVGALGYRGPECILSAMERVAPSRRYDTALDLGCGTGLMARHLEGRAATIDGVDLSPRMIEKAQATGLYRELQVADVATALERHAPDAYDLVLAADVFVYLAELDGVIRRCAAVLRIGGVLAFTLQRSAGEPVRFGADMRFSHGADHVASTLAAAGLHVALLEVRSTRRDAGVDVPGLVVVAVKA